MSIIRNINSITDLTRGSSLVNFVYRGTALVWQRGTVLSTRWLTKGLSTILSNNKAGQDVWVTEGLNTKFR